MYDIIIKAMTNPYHPRADIWKVPQTKERNHEAVITWILCSIKPRLSGDLDRDYDRLLKKYSGYKKQILAKEKDLFQRIYARILLKKFKKPTEQKDPLCKHSEVELEYVCNGVTGEVKRKYIVCASCGRDITDELVMPLGKYAGKKLSWIVKSNPAYAEWASKNLSQHLSERLSMLLFTLND